MSVTYVAYIDESGDPSIKPIKLPGGSEWFILSCLLVRENMVPALSNAHYNILSQFTNRQTDVLHFNRLIPAKKFIACQGVARTPCRGFVAISNKKNIINYNNQKIRSNDPWLYWWMTRILLEKVTDWCHRHAARNGVQSPKIRLIFERRGGNDYDKLMEYLNKLHIQSQAGELYINHDDIKWDLIDFNEIHVIDKKNSKGLQLSDTITGAFCNSLHPEKNNHDLTYAKTLHPIIAMNSSGNRIDYGIKTRPYINQMDLTNEQRAIFDFYRDKGR